MNLKIISNEPQRRRGRRGIEERDVRKTSVLDFVLEKNMTLKVGETAPDFTLTSQAGSSVSLKDFRGQKNVIVYFYSKDDSPGCTTQACAFRDSYEVFKDAGGEVVGISDDSQQSHQKFATKYQ